MCHKTYICFYIFVVTLAVSFVTGSAVAQDASMSDSFRLTQAVKKKNYANVRSMLSKGANVNTRDYQDGSTPLYLASRMKDVVIVTFLLNAEAKTDIPLKKTGETPLMAAVSVRGHEVVKLLLGQNADVDIKDRNGETALYKAVQINDRTMVKTLLDAGADWSLADNTGRTPLDLTTEDRRLRSIARVLEGAGAEY